MPNRNSIFIFLCLMHIAFMNFSCTSNWAKNQENSGSNEFKNRISDKELKKISKLTLSPLDYKKWVSKNCQEQRKAANLTFSLLFKPHEYIVCVESSSDEITVREQERIKKEIDGMEYFDLRIILNDGNGELLKYNLSGDDKYEDRVKYYAFQFPRDIFLISGKADTIHPSLFHFERGYNIAPYSTFSLGFLKDQIDYSGDITVIVKDKIFNSGFIEFTYNAKQFKQLPKLKTL